MKNMLDKNWGTIRPLTFDGSITEYEFLCKILNQIETVQKELQEEIDNIVVGGGGITDEERQKIDSLTNTGIQLMNSLTKGDVGRLKVLTDDGANWANQINGYEGDENDVVARANWVLQTAQRFFDEIAPRLLPTVSAADNGKVAKVVGGKWAIGTVDGGGDSKWNEAAVEYFATVLEHLVYDDASTGQTAATYLLNILRGEAPFITGITAEWSYGQVIYPDTALTSDMFTVKAAYSDGSVVQVTEFSFSPQVASANPTEVTITFEGKTATVSVPVGTVSLTGITAEYVGAGTIYVGDNLTKNMFKVTAKYNDGSSNAVSDYTFTPVTMVNAGEQVVTFTYQGKETTATVTVVALIVTKIRASWIGGTIFKGTAFTKSMFTVTAEYNNGTSKAVSYFTFSPATANSTPTTLVIIEYEGKSTGVSVNVSDATASNLVVNSYTLNSGVARIYPGDKFLEKGKFNVTVNYSDGSSSTITDNSGLAVSPESADSAGNILVTVSLAASPLVNGTVNITVSEAPKVNKITAIYNGLNNPKAGDVLTIANFTVIHTDQYQNVIHDGWTKDYLSNETATEIESITVVEGEQTVYVRCLTNDARTLVTSTVVTGEKAQTAVTYAKMYIYPSDYDTSLGAMQEPNIKTGRGTASGWNIAGSGTTSSPAGVHGQTGNIGFEQALTAIPKTIKITRISTADVPTAANAGYDGVWNLNADATSATGTCKFLPAGTTKTLTVSTGDITWIKDGNNYAGISLFVTNSAYVMYFGKMCPHGVLLEVEC